MTAQGAPRSPAVDGILPVDKPGGMTSHDVVARARRALNTRAIGHAGTLDPMATGLLILCVGSATRLSEYLLDHDKTYLAELTLGARTNTDDAEGIVTVARPVPELDRVALEAALVSFKGDLMQIPPQFSAIQRAGERAYVAARRGETVDLPARPVHVHKIVLAAWATPRLTLEITCSSGTYIRAIARDLGELLGCGAHLSALRRTRIGDFDVRTAVPLDAIAPDRMLPPDAAVRHLPSAILTPNDTLRFLRGQSAPYAGVSAGPVRVHDAQGRLLGIARSDPAGGALHPVKVLAGAAP